MTSQVSGLSNWTNTDHSSLRIFDLKEVKEECLKSKWSVKPSQRGVSQRNMENSQASAKVKPKLLQDTEAVASSALAVPQDLYLHPLLILQLVTSEFLHSLNFI